MNIPFLSFAPQHAPIRAEMTQAFEKVYDSYWYILGKTVTEFEKAYAEFSGTQYCVGVSNGLDALYLSLKALAIGEGDEVIVPSNTYIATVLSVTYTGATPVFVEPDIKTYNIDPSKIEAAITPKTKAIMPVHLYGQCCEMGPLMEIAERHGLKVVEDNAQAHGATYKGKITGSWGHLNATSFYPGKNFGALGDAGAITTDNDQLAKDLLALRNYGSSRKYYNDVIGHNMRLDELQAALLQVKLKYLMEWTAQRRQIAKQYDRLLQNTAGLQLPYSHPDATHAYHLYVIRCLKRDELQQYLNSKGIGTLIHYPVPPHLQEAYKSLGYKKGDFPIAEELADTSLSIPLWPGMTTEMVDYISAQIKSFCEA